jgi:hypothetical protein
MKAMTTVRWLLVSCLFAVWTLELMPAGEPGKAFVEGEGSSSIPARAAAEDIKGQDLPSGYRLLYEESFENAEALADFVTTDAQAWRIASIEQKHALELSAQSRYQPPVRSPVNMAMIRDRVFGDFVMECDLMQTGREYGHRDMCLFFGFESPSRFYYAHIATAADDHAHNIFVVNEQPRTKIADETTQGVNWGLNVWHRVRIERTLEDGLIKVYYDDLKKPIMVATDETFRTGYIGFGSFDDTGMIANIRVWGPPVEMKPGPQFVQP